MFRSGGPKNAYFGRGLKNSSISIHDRIIRTNPRIHFATKPSDNHEFKAVPRPLASHTALPADASRPLVPFKSHPLVHVKKIASHTINHVRKPDNNESEKPHNKKVMGSYRNLFQKLKDNPGDNFKSMGSSLLALIVLLYFMYCLYKDYVKESVIDKSVLRNDECNKIKNLAVVDAITLKSSGHEPSAGRSHGHMVMHAHENETHKFYYYKEPFNRKGLLNELVIGLLGRELFGEKFPRVLAVETPINDMDDDSRYTFISESLGGHYENQNLEVWAEQYAKQSHSDFYPKHLGEALAFDMIMGKSDCKLANLIVTRDHHCYSIDHESVFNGVPKFILSANDALMFIGEFQSKNIADYIHEDNSGGSLDANENIHQPLKSNNLVKSITAPLLRQAIQTDIDEGQIIQFYKRFANLSEAQIQKIFTRFGSLVQTSERDVFMEQIKVRQALTKEFIAQYEKDHQKDAVESLIDKYFSWTR